MEIKVYVDIGASFFRHPKDQIDSGWEVHLIEPIEEHHLTNCNTYKNYQNVYCHQVAIDTTSGKRDLMIPNEEYLQKNNIQLTGSIKGTAGFNPVDKRDQRKNKVFQKHGELMYKKQTVNCVTFDQFTEANRISKVDYLKTDTEGHDIEILKTVDLDRYQVKTLKFEHIWAKRRNLEEYNLFVQKINSLGFELKEEGPYDQIYAR